MPNDRRVLLGTYASPQESYSTTNTQETLEEGISEGTPSSTKYKISTDATKSLKSSIVKTISVAQSDDDGTANGWSSRKHQSQTWQMDDDIIWQRSRACWNGKLAINNGDAKVLRDLNAATKALYIKNLGSNELRVSLDNGSTYPILVPPAAGLAIEPNIDAEEIKVDTVSGNTIIEYIVAT
tara:strand:+ start:217 stop:762 length:546 start_codon:yes stop_codon:yes gene_type:complete